MVRRMLQVLWILALAAGLATMSGCGKEGDDETTDTYEETVLANQIWTPTEIALQADDEVEISATGTIMYDATGAACNAATPCSCDPNGVPGLITTPENGRQDPLQVEHGKLIGRIGETGNPFPVGASFTLTVPLDGTLWLGVNDAWFEGNTGSFAVTVKVTSKDD